MKLELDRVCAGYDRDAVLQEVSLQVKEGTFAALLGPSGCGKTTLLKTIAGIVPAQSGRILLDGRDITSLPIHKRGTVVLFQDLRLFPHLSALDNVAFPLKMQGVSKSRRRERAAALLERVQMGEMAGRLPRELSGGQQQRVALARALAAEPSLLLLDEPFSSLDENLRGEMRQLVLSLQRELGMTVLLVTHDRGEALSLSEQVTVMFAGRLAQTGTPQEVYERPLTRQVADYFGGCVYLKGSVRGGVFHAAEGAVPVQAADGDYVMLFRPAALRLDLPGDFPVTVRELRYLGAETAVLFTSPGGEVWQRTIQGAPPWRIGERISASLDWEQGILFSASS